MTFHRLTALAFVVVSLFFFARPRQQPPEFEEYPLDPAWEAYVEQDEPADAPHKVEEPRPEGYAPLPPMPKVE